MKFSNEDIRKSIEETTPLFQAARRANVALQIRSKMHEKGLKNRDIAERLGVSEANISRWLRGNQNLGVDTIYQLADALEESVEIFVGAAHISFVEPNAVPQRDDRGEWEIRQKPEAAAAASGSDLMTHGRVGNVYSLDPYRALRQIDDSRRTFVSTKCGFGISMDEEERAYK